MYCPKCGQQQSAEEVFYCSRCGLKLDVVRTSLTGEADRLFSTITLPKHRDINSGVALMLPGTLLTSGFVVLGDVGPAGAFLLLTLILISVLLSSSHLMRAIQRLISREDPGQGYTSAGSKGMCFGALLMYIGTVLSTCAATMVTGHLWVPTFFFTLHCFRPASAFLHPSYAVSAGSYDGRGTTAATSPTPGCGKLFTPRF